MSTSASRLRTAAALSAAAIALHELRYLIGGEPNSAAEGAHGYLPVLGVLVGLAAVAAVARFAAALAAARGEDADAFASRSFGTRWLVFTLALVAIFFVQEGLEGLFAAGHPATPAALVAHAGWSVPVVALALGAAIAFVLTRAEEALRRPADGRPPRLSQRPPLQRARRSFVRPQNVLARHLAGRAPPLSS